MKEQRILVLFLAAICPVIALGRAVRVLEMKDLIAEAKLVFVGRAVSVEPSGITTTMSYPTWHGVTFEWLKVEVEVLEPLKGVEKGERIHTLMLGMRGQGGVANGPGMVEPDKGRVYLLCLLPTTISNVHASLTAPWDDDQAIFLLDRKSWVHEGATYYNDEGKEVPFHKQSEKNSVLWSLVDDDGNIRSSAVTQIRKRYSAEIAKAPPKSTLIHLRWETFTSPGGWQWDVPKGDTMRTNGAPPTGPITMPGPTPRRTSGSSEPSQSSGR